jgi:hypothetical protein
MNSFDVSNWKEFELSRLFIIKSPAARIMRTYNEGEVPYVSSSGINNGIVAYLEPKENEKLEKGNCISVSPLEGTPAFYQEDDFLGRGGAGSAVSLLYNDNLTKNNALFICVIIKVAAQKFDYSDALTGDNLRSLKIKLPAKCDNGCYVIDKILNYNDEGNIPDWNYMSEYIDSLKDKAQFKIENLLRIRGNQTAIDILKWKEFKIKDVFITNKIGKELQVPTGASVPAKELKSGEVPKISVSGIDNGIVGFYTSEHKNFRVYNNFLSVSFLGTVFYQESSAFLDMKVHCLKPMDFELNKYTGLFLIAVIKEALKKFTYGDQISSTVLPDLLIKLPINDKDKIDLKYMEEIMRVIEEKSMDRLNILKELVE